MGFRKLLFLVLFSTFLVSCSTEEQENKDEQAKIEQEVVKKNKAEEDKIEQTTINELLDTQQVIIYKELNFYKNDRSNSIKVEFPRYNENMSYRRDDKKLKKLVKIYDENNNLVPLDTLYYTYKQIYLKADFEKDKKYRLVIDGVVEDNNLLKVSYDYKKEFIFKSQKLTSKNLRVSPTLKDLKSAHFTLYFDTGEIFTKDIRKYLEFDDNIKYAYKISGYGISIYGDFKPNTSYSFSLKKGFNAGTSIVQEDLKLKASFGDINKSLKFKFNDYKSYVSSYTQAVDIETTNLNYVKVNIIKVNSENLNFLNLFKRNDLTEKYNQTDYKYKRYGEVVEKYKKTVANIKNKVISTQLDFRDKLERKDDGIYLITINNNEHHNISDSKLVFKSDLGISIKVAKNQMFFSIRSLATNKPIENAEISVFSKTNKLLFRQKTNKFGILDKRYENILNSKPRLVVVKKGQKINFLYLDNPIASSFDIVNDLIKEKEHEALVFMERSLLRPNDSANILVSVKNKALKSLKNQDLYLEFIDPTQKKLFTKKLRLNEVGIAEYEFKSFNNYKTGKYRVNVFLGKSQIAYKEFYVEAFVPEKIEVKIESLEDKFLAKQNIKFDLQSKYLFGTPAKGLKYDMQIVADNSYYVSKNYKEYSFSNDLKTKFPVAIFNDKGVLTEAPVPVFNDKGVLDEKGLKSFDVKMSFYKTENSMLSTNLIATVFDDGRAVRKSKELEVYPFDTIVGLKKENKSNIEVNKPLKISPILLNPLTDSKISDIQRLKIKVYKKYYHYYAGEELRQIESYSVNSNNDIVITPKESGEYYVLAETEQGQVSVSFFYASGWDYDSVNLKDKSSYKVEIKTNKDIYNIDDKISLDIKSPILGKLLLTIEEDEILEYKQIDLSKNTANLEIKMPKGIKKGIYIKAQVVRDTNSSNDILPFRVVGSKYIKKNNDDKKINVQIINKELYKSGEEVKIEVKGDVKANSYAVISVVDSGILNIINEKATDAFAYFNKDGKDNVYLYDLYSNLQRINKLISQSPSGGGDFTELRKEKHLSPAAINERVKPISFWSKIIKLDENAEGVFTFKFPNFNGEVLIQALIISEDKIGSSSKKAVVKDDIVIKPTLPRFLIKGDDVIIPVRLLNTTKELQNLDLVLQSTSNLLIKEDKKILTLNPKESKIVEVKAKALDVGLSKFLIKLSTSKDNFTNENSLYIKDNLDYKLESINKIIKPKQTINLEVIDKKTQALNTPVRLTVGVDNSPFAKLSKVSKDLIRYPHGCVEQISSKLLALVMSKKFIDKSDSKLLFEREMFIKEGIEKLISRQKSNGLFSYWESGYINSYASFYATFVLGILKEVGFNIPEDVWKKAGANWSSFRKNSEHFDFIIPYANKNDINRIYDNKLYGKTLASYVGLAAAMKKYNYKDEYKNLIQAAKEYFKLYDMSRERVFVYSFYSPIKDIATSLYLYSTYISNDTNDEFANDLLRTVTTYINEDKLYSTQDKAFAMLALSSYYKGFDLSKKDVNVTLKYENQLKDIKNKYYKNIVLKNNYTLSFTNNGNTVVNYIVDINKPIDLATTSEEITSSKPLELKTEIVNQKGEVIDYKAINIGEKLFMKVEVSSRKRVDNVAVNVQIPSGLEIINPRLYKSNEVKFKNINYKPDYKDYRDDRVQFYLTTTSKPTIMYIPLIATTKGEFVYPASYIEAMYDSRLNSYSKATKKLHIK